jgi:hypothetical protein
LGKSQVSKISQKRVVKADTCIDEYHSIGLLSIQSGPPLPISLPRAKGFDMGIVAVLETPEHIATYAVHPAHLEYVA